jgi:hypothetical protein
MTVSFGVLERSLIMRTIALWLLVRLMLGLIWLLMAAFTGVADGDPVFLAPSAAMLAVVVTAGLSWLATRLSREDLLLANLGTPAWIGLGLMCIPPLVLELVTAQFGSP